MSRSDLGGPGRCYGGVVTRTSTGPPLFVCGSPPRGWRSGCDVALIVGTLLLLTSIAGAAVVASPIVVPLLILAWRRSSGVLRWVYALLCSAIAVEALIMFVHAIAGSNRVPARAIPGLRATGL